jgi:hypothetical protein
VWCEPRGFESVVGGCGRLEFDCGGVFNLVGVGLVVFVFEGDDLI